MKEQTQSRSESCGQVKKIDAFPDSLSYGRWLFGLMKSLLVAKPRCALRHIQRENYSRTPQRGVPTRRVSQTPFTALDRLVEESGESASRLFADNDKGVITGVSSLDFDFLFPPPDQTIGGMNQLTHMAKTALLQDSG